MKIFILLISFFVSFSSFAQNLELETVCGSVSKRTLTRLDDVLDTQTFYVIRHTDQYNITDYYFSPMKPMCDCPEYRYIKSVETAVESAYQERKNICIKFARVVSVNEEFVGFANYFENVNPIDKQISSLKEPATGEGFYFYFDRP